MSLNEIVRDSLSSTDGRILVLGKEGTSPLEFQGLDRMIYCIEDSSVNPDWLVEFIRIGGKLDVLRIGKDINATILFSYYYGVISEGGLLIVDSPSFSLPTIVGSFTLLHTDEDLQVFKRDPVPQTISFAIVMATYHRKAGTTKQFVERSLASIAKQSYQNFKLFLIGDRYENEEEFKEFAKLLPAEQLHMTNLPVALE